MTDINNMALGDEVVSVDPNASSEDFFNPPLPDDGPHEAIMRLGNKGIEETRKWEGRGSSRKKTGDPYLNVHVQLKAVKDGGGEGGTLGFDNLSTLVMDSGTSRLHAAMDLFGFKLPATATITELRALIEQAMAQNPQGIVTTQWLAQVNRGTKDNPDYKDLCRGQKKFQPVLDSNGEPTGRYNPEVYDSQSELTIRAQAKIIKYARRK